MIKITTSITGSAEIRAKLGKVSAEIARDIDAMLQRHGAQMEKEIKQSMKSGGRLGRVGPRGGKVVRHSKPGEPPYVQSGQLRATIGFYLDRPLMSGKIEFVLKIGTLRGNNPVQHAAPLELGTSHGLRPRPFLKPVVDRHRELIHQDLVRILQEASK